MWGRQTLRASLFNSFSPPIKHFPNKHGTSESTSVPINAPGRAGRICLMPVLKIAIFSFLLIF